MRSMNKLTAVAIGFICAVLLSTAAAQTGPSAASINISPPAEKFAMSPGGVDLRTGRYAFDETDLSIGGRGNNGLTFSRILSTATRMHIDPFANLSHNWDITLVERRVRFSEQIVIIVGNLPMTVTRSGYDFYASVNIGGRTDAFKGDFDAIGYGHTSRAPFTRLTFTGNRETADVVYTYEANDGTRIVFKPLGPFTNGYSGGRITYASQIVHPDGTTLTLDYDTTTPVLGVTNSARLRSVQSNRGYALVLEYSGTGVAWNLITKACVLNLSVTAKPDNNICHPAASAATYTYTTFANAPKLATVTNPLGETNSYTYSPQTGTQPPRSTFEATYFPQTGGLPPRGYSMGFVNAGQSIPWQVANVELVPTNDGTDDQIVTQQTFSDGSGYTYLYDAARPAGEDRYGQILGGQVIDALGHLTVVKYGFGIRLPTPPLTGPQPRDRASGPQPLQTTPGPLYIKDPLGRTTNYQYCDPAVAITSTTPCRVLQLFRTTDPEGNKNDFSYTVGYATTSRRIAKSGSGLADIVVSVGTNFVCSPTLVLCGKPPTSADANGNITNYTYDPTHGGVLTITSPAPIPGGVRPQNRFSYSQFYAWYKNSSGTLIQSPSPIWLLTSISECRTVSNCVGTADETRTTFTYGTPGTPNSLWLTSMTVSAGDGSISATTRTTYDSQGNVLTVDGPLPGSADTARTRYDALRRVVGTISPDPDGAGPLPHRAVRNTYNTTGDLVQVDTGTVPSQSDADWPLFAVQQTLNTTYDLMGRKLREAVSSNGVTFGVKQYSYDLAQRLECAAARMDPSQWHTQPNACVPQITGPEGPDRITRNVYNAAGERIKLQVAVGTADEADEETYTYTANGRVKTVTDGEGNVTTYDYDGHDRLVQTRFPDKALKGISSSSDYEQLAYDSNGNTTQHRLRDGQMINYQFDALNRQVLKDLPHPEMDVSYDYDLQARPLTSSQGSDYIALSYDALGRALNEATAQTVMSYEYDLAGRRTRTTWSDGFFVTHDYLTTGELSAIREYGAASGIGVLATYNYDSLGRRSSLTRGNGTTTTYGYDGVSQLALLSHDVSGTAQDVSSTFTYNPASQIASWSRNNDAFAWNGHYNQNKSYAINGLNQITTAGGIGFDYDGRGNLTVNGANTYSYTAENRLLAGPNVNYSYDPIGRLAQSAGTTGTTRFQYDGTDLVAEYNTSNQLLRRYVHGPGDDEPLVWYEGSGTGDKRWFHQDERGSTVVLSDSIGTAFAINAYDEYGIPASSNQGRFQYTGQTWMPELNMYYYKARMYSPALGRFLQTDPVGYKDGINWYAYVDNDPINGADPTGKIIDTIADVGFILYDIKTIYDEGFNTSNVVALGLDVAGAIVPFVTGAGQAYRTASSLHTIAKEADKAGTAGMIARAAGTAKHTEAARLTKEALPDAAVEQAFKNGAEQSSRVKDSVVPDVVTNTPGGKQPFDFKFGDAGTSSARNANNQANVGTSRNTIDIRPGTPPQGRANGLGAACNVADSTTSAGPCSGP
jgi:RHS repeat-associated protein